MATSTKAVGTRIRGMEKASISTLTEKFTEASISKGRGMALEFLTTRTAIGTRESGTTAT